MHTNSYRLSEECKFLIHACGPRWYDYSKDKKKVCFNDLKNTFYNILIWLNHRHLYFETYIYIYIFWPFFINKIHLKI